MRVVIGIPVYRFWEPEMGTSLIGALRELPCEWGLRTQRGPYIDTNREACVEQALAADADYIIFVDTDLMFPPETFTQLLSAKKDIVGANYNEKRLPLVSTVRIWNEDRTDFKMGDALPAQPFEAAALPTGLICINLKRLVQCMAPPYFNYETRERLGLLALVNASENRGGEDVAFSIKAGRCGLSVWCDPTIPVKHMGQFAF